MTHETVAPELRSVVTALPTPFDDQLEVDHAALAENARAVYDEGIGTLMACANISEYHSLSRDERVAVTETSVESLAAGATDRRPRPLHSLTENL